MSVVKALIEVKRSGFGARSRNIAFYYPVVVLEGQLFTSRLEAGSLVVEEATSIPVSFRYRSPKYGDEEKYTVLIVRESTFESEIERLDSWLAECSSYLKKHTQLFETLAGTPGSAA